ncbi:MAG: DUF3253 domain-containing protein [Thermoflexales bacterium]
MSNPVPQFAIRQLILELAMQRGPGKTLCPSEVARAWDSAAWRAWMPAVREAAFALAEEGRVVITQRGRPVDRTARGPIRIALKATQ